VSLSFFDIIEKFYISKKTYKKMIFTMTNEKKDELTLKEKINKVADWSPYDNKNVEVQPNRQVEEQTSDLGALGIMVSLVAFLICIVSSVYLWNYDIGYTILGTHIPIFAYRSYVGIFAIGAFVSLGGLIFSLSVNSKQSKSQVISNPVQSVKFDDGISQIHCGSCGTMNDIDAVYCKKCARQFR